MRALVIRKRDAHTREKVLVGDWPEPAAPAGNQVSIRTLFSGVTNGTERNQLLQGNYAPSDRLLPLPTGYQTVGRVEEVGPQVASLCPGDTVFVGKSTGGHLERIVVAEDDLLIKLPGGVDLREAALFGMGAVALNTCRNAQLRLGEEALVVGAGCIGQIAAQVAALWGARVTICDIDDRRLEVAREIGAVEQALQVEGALWGERIREEGFDAALDFAGAPGMEDALISAVRMGGRVLFIAGRDRVSYTFNLGQRRLINIMQNSHFSTDDLENLCRLVARGLVSFSPLLREVAPAEEAGRVYDLLRDRPGALLGTVFSW